MSGLISSTFEVGPAKYTKRGMLSFGRYENEDIAILVVSGDGRIQAKATVCIPERKAYPGVWLKGWSENEGIPDALQSAGHLFLTDQCVDCGFEQAVYAVLSLPLIKFLSEIVYDGERKWS